MYKAGIITMVLVVPISNLNLLSPMTGDSLRISKSLSCGVLAAPSAGVSTSVSSCPSTKFLSL